MARCNQVWARTVTMRLLVLLAALAACGAGKQQIFKIKIGWTCSMQLYISIYKCQPITFFQRPL